MDYALIKTIHVSAVAVTLGLFILRARWALHGSPALQKRWAKILPHVVDTVLLASAIWLAWQLHQAPGKDAWLTAKVIGLLVYIVAGTMAIKRARTRSGKIAGLVVALLTFAYIIGVAVTKSPLSWAHLH